MSVENNIENSIKDCIQKELEKGVIEKVLAQKLEECIATAVKDMFSWSGNVKKVIEDKVKSVMIPYLENYDYSEYITKLDSVLVEVLKNSALENKKLIENFKELMLPEKKESIKASDLFNIWTEFVAEEVNTDDLEVNYDDGVSYEPVNVSMEIEYNEERNWSSFEYATLILECEQDKEVNFEIKLSRWKQRKEKLWDISYRTNHEISSLRNLNKFEIILMNFAQNFTKIELDTDYESDDITPEKEPEATFS